MAKKYHKKPPLSTATLIKDIGEAAAATTTRRRTSYLRAALASGRITPAQLGASDRSLVGQPAQQSSVTGGGGGGGLSLGPLHISGDVGTGISNFFSGAEKFATGLPVGVYNLGKSFAQDITNPNLYGRRPSSKDSAIIRNVVDPTIQSYRHKYSGSLGQILHKALVEDPFGTTLDVGALASAGAGTAVKAGSIAGRVGRGVEALGGEQIGGTLRNVGRGLTKFGTPKERPGFVPPPSREFRARTGAAESPGAAPIPQGRYSKGLFMRQGQKLTDVLLGTGKMGVLRHVPTPNIPGATRFSGLGETLGETYAHLKARPLMTQALGEAKLRESGMIAQESRPMVQALKKADPEEVIAVDLLKRGVNPQQIAERGGITFIEAYRQNLVRSLEGKNPHGFNVGDASIAGLGVDRGYTQWLADELGKTGAESKIVANLHDPTPKMKEISGLYDQQIERNMETLPIDASEHRQRVWQSQEYLRTDPESIVAAGNEQQLSGINSYLDPSGAYEKFSHQYAQQAGQPFAVRPNYIPDEVAQGTFRITRKGPQIKTPGYSKRIAASNIANKLTRPPVPTMLRDSDMRLFAAGAIRTDGREMLNMVQQREHFLAQGGGLEELINSRASRTPDGELATAKNSNDMVDQGFDRNTHMILPVDGLARFFKKETDHIGSLGKIIDRMQVDDAATIEGNLSSLRQSLNDLTETEAKIGVDETVAATKPEGIIISKHDGQYLLDTMESMQPKGWMNWFMNKWRNQILFWMPRWYVNTAVGSAVLGAIHGSLWNPKALIASAHWARGDRHARLTQAIPGHDLGIQGAEIAETMGTKGAIVDTKLSYAGARAAEHIEGFFRRAALFHTLNKENRLNIRQMDEALEPYQKGLFKDEYIDELIQDPELTRAATNSMNEFFYNYTNLGALERATVRKFIPFWGWYKFATKFVWRLPFAYPGRADIISKLGDAGRDATENELGILPPWVKGSIFLNNNPHSLDYMSTLGINPLATFANPLGPRGPIGGSVEMTQINPLIQGLFSAAGVDPLKGSAVELSPQGSYGTGLFGTPYNLATGEQTPGGFLSAGGFQRYLGGVARAFPLARLSEEAQTQGRGVYPESIPNPYLPGIGGINLGTVRPLPAPPDKPSEVTTSLLRGLFGGSVFPKRGYDLAHYQDFLKSDLAIARGKQKSQLDRLRKYGAIR